MNTSQLIAQHNVRGALVWAWERIAYGCMGVGGHNDVSSYLSEWLGPGGMVAEWLCQAQCGAFNMAKVA